MKVFIQSELKKEPYGGGNQFLKALKKVWAKEDRYANNPKNADFILFNSHDQLDRVYKLKKKYPNKIFIHRIDGPMSGYRPYIRLLDKLIFLFSEKLADGVVFQSKWCLDQSIKNGFNGHVVQTVIHNASDSEIFYKNGSFGNNITDKIKLIATSWSSSYNKGFDIYKYLDENLDFNKYDFTFIGNSPIKFRNIKHIQPLPSSDIGHYLRKSHIKVFASGLESCSNSLIESLSCGLPVVYKAGSSNAEIVKNAGLPFTTNEEAINSIESICENYDIYKDSIQIRSIKDIAGDYYSTFEKAQNEKNINSKFVKKSGVKFLLKHKLFDYLIKLQYFLRSIKKMDFRQNISRKIKITKSLFGDLFYSYLGLYVLGIINAFLTFIGIGLILPILAFVLKVGSEDLAVPYFIKSIMNYTMSNWGFDIICITLFVVIVTKNITIFMVQYKNSKIVQTIRGHWIADLFNKYIFSNYTFFTSKKHGELVNNLYNVTSDAQKGFRQLVAIFMNFTLALISFTAMMLLSWKLSIFLLLLIFILYYVFYSPLTKISTHLGSIKLKIYGKVQSIPNDAFKGIREIKTYSLETDVKENYSKAIEDMVNNKIRMVYYQLLPSLLPEILLISLFCTTLIYLDKTQNNSLNTLFPILMTYTYAGLRFLGAITPMIKNYLAFNTNKPSINRLHSEMTKSEHEESKSNNKLLLDTGNLLNIENINFNYSEGNSIINNLKISFNKGQLTAIVGSSGSGKSTIVDLILRLYKPTSGRIALDGININEFNLSKWRKNIGIVNQDTFLFNGTIKENIMLSDAYTDNDMYEAAKKVNAHEFILNRIDGYDSLVGERGAKLSGGQRQRISLVRALIRKPKILILDEATSALDPEIEQDILNFLYEIKKETIMILISHRISTIRDADNIIVLNEGMAAQEGTHESLIKSKGIYQKLYDKS